MPDSHSGWGRAGHRRAVLVGAVVVAVLVGGGAAAWASVSTRPTGYRLTSVTRSDIATTLGVVGNVDPVSQATASFQVAGKVATVTVAPGQTVTGGQTLGTLDPTSLEESVSSAQSTVQADEARLAEDESNQSSGTSSASKAAPTSSAQPSTSTSVPSTSASGAGSSTTIAQDQANLTQDEATLDSDQQKEAADLAQAQSDCTSAGTATTAGRDACEAMLQTVSADEQQVSRDQSGVSKDETALGQALTAASGGSTGGGTGSGGVGSSPTQNSHALSSASGVSLTAVVTSSSGSGGSGSLGAGGASASGNTDTPAQIASDQAAIDTAQAQLTNAEQSLKEATLTSPIDGTVVSVSISVGDSVSAGSSTETITVIGTNSFEAQSTLDSSQVPSVTVGQSATVRVDGVDRVLAATVVQVGPVESSSSGYSYPVVVSLPASAGTLHAGAAASITIATGRVADVVAVPTSAVQTLGSRTYVLVLAKGELTRKVVTVGMVGDEYTQVLSGLMPGQGVVLADYSESVPSSSTNTVSGIGNLLGGGGGGLPSGFGGAGSFRLGGGAAGFGRG